MHVGYGTGFQHLSGTSDTQFMREELGNCEAAESLGFESVWATEHHFDSYSISPDVCQLLSYLAGKTKRIKLGSMVIVVPWHDPVRLAEQIVLLDHYSGGRYILGVGRGLARREFEGLRIDPCIPKSWPGFKMVRHFRGNTVRIEVKNPTAVNRGIKSLTIDGRSVQGNVVPVDRLRDGAKIVATLG